MLLILRLSLRNLQRHFRRSLITIVSIGFGLAVILWLQAILLGSNRNIIETITSTYHGNMQIFRKDYHQDHLLQQTFDPSTIQLHQLKDEKFAASPRLMLPALISSGEQSLPIVLQGIDPEKEVKITRIKEALVAGEFLGPEDVADCSTHAAYLSQALAKLLGVGLGNKVVVLAQAADGSLGNELLRVKGLFDTGSPEYDKGLVFTTRSCVESIGALSGVHEIAFRFDDPDREEIIHRKISDLLPDDLVGLTWRQVEPRLAAMTNFNDATILLVSSMLFIVISLGILNTFLVTVFERTSEFGVMMALGTPPSKVVLLVLAESFVLALAASLLGILVGALLIIYNYIYGFDLEPLVGENLSVGAFQLNLIVYPVISWAQSLWATGITILVVMLSAIYPALRASRLKPIEAIRAQ